MTPASRFARGRITGIRITRFSNLRYNKTAMDIVRLGKKGQISLPKAILKHLGLTGEALLLVEACSSVIPLPSVQAAVNFASPN